ncbi:ribosome recycling factor family protein [Vibrio vulnificus]|uniref:ribosome recycling factor family protein n=1 Tax=Vibrio vulnificus TaxID=672 RepID=UPI0012ADCE34|nr:ribosome recycling factor family protein [Vibrio vulnificus]ELI0349530.1 ribosome recycling factor family protein [Vibrio vulnificus]ELI0351583.1 ribosome recycling factor family protein [Vibrio vulnificus]ELI0609168.1 ribosome recycling factor family protein [Vibrio vulnificus]ELI0612709.1 ribosome recycling factor family protein [Vibrio vulnificus]MCU8224719.1 ribosome recycling factor family protein [Vibrio vulnificus]
MKAKPVNEQLVVIALPSLIHRIGGEMTKHLKSVAADHGCELKRVRRSRHWQISGEALALQAFYDQVRRLEENSASYLVKKMQLALASHSEKLEPLEDKLQRLVMENPAITLAELMSQTHCSLSQARSARFSAEGL